MIFYKILAVPALLYIEEKLEGVNIDSRKIILF